MNTYLFKTTATMKKYNNNKWWIDCDIIPDLYIDALDINNALKEYQKITDDKYYISVSDTALKRKSAMYIDTENGTKQIGYVITGSSEFQDDKSYSFSRQFIDLWVSIERIENAF